jgi:hypothetical protein
MCTLKLCESCGIIYAKGKDIADILNVKRPPNKKLWSVFFDSEIKTQKAVPFQKSKSSSSWASFQGFSSKEIKA